MSDKTYFSQTRTSFSMILRLFCWMLLACMKCDFQPNGIFNILKIHTYIHVIPHFQGMSFYFRVKKIYLEKKHMIEKNVSIVTECAPRESIYNSDPMKINK